MSARVVTFVTGNLRKLAVAREHLAPFGVQVEHVALPLPEVQAATVREVALYKARAAVEAVGGPVLVEDSGFYIDELNFPGPFVKYVIEMMGAQKLARLADLTRDRRCHFCSVLVYHPGAGDPWVFEDRGSTGTVAEQVVTTETPQRWSAVWDLYIPDGFDRPASQLSPEENAQRFQRWATRSVYHQLGAALTRS